MMIINYMDTACAILAGGKSSRMGQDKATAEFNGMSLIGGVFMQVNEVFDEIIVVSSRHPAIKDVDIPIVRDIAPVQSPVVGIATALMHCESPRVFVVACDMPFLTPDALRCILDGYRGKDITIPMVSDYYEPLHAIYARSCLAHFLRLIGRDNLKISGIFPYVTKTVIRDDPCFRHRDGRAVFSNINTREELTGIDSIAMCKEYA